jgi:FkbM family methyltransferase
MKKIARIFRRLVLTKAKFLMAIDPSYYYKRIFFGSAVVEVNGFKMFLDLKNDVGISKDLFLFRKREHLSTDYLIENDVIQEGQTVLDIGANIGYYALLESRLVGKKGEVYAIEPVLKNYTALKKNVELNDAANVKTFNMAAGNVNGDMEIFVADKGNISSFIPKGDANFVSKQKVQMVRVDNFVSDRDIKPDFIRMDVEGFETEIIKGMADTLKTKPKLLIEVHPNIASKEDLMEMISAIRDSGYKKVIEIKERNLLWMNRNGQLKNSLKKITSIIDGQYASGMGKVEHKSIDELLASMDQRGSAFHALIY